MPAFPALAVPSALLARPGGIDRIRRVAELVVVVLLAVQAARLAWLLLPPAALDDASPAPADLPVIPTARLAIDAFHPATVQAAADASGLRLFALRPAVGGGSAIIAAPDAPQQSHAVGDEVAPGVRLAEVHADHVVLDAGGRRSELRFPGRTAARPAPPAEAARTATPAPAPGIDAMQLLAEAGLSPVEAGGRVAGYTVIPRGDGAVLRQAGLQAGDVLLSVNGQELTPERYAELGDVLGGASTLTLTYRRDGQLRTATLQAKTP